MHQTRILHNLINGVCTIENVVNIDRVKEFVFTNPSNLALFDEIRKHVTRTGKIPSKGIIKHRLSIDKNNAAKEAFAKLEDAGKKVEISQDELDSYVEIQVKYNLKTKVMLMANEFSSDVGQVGSERLMQRISDFQHSLNLAVRSVSGNSRNDIEMYRANSAQEAYERYKREKETNPNLPRLGVVDVDRHVNGIREDDLITILAWTGHGKSTMMRFWAYNMILQGKNVYFQTEEMSSKSIEQYMHCLHANNLKVWPWNKPRIDFQRVRTGTLSRDEEDFLYREVAVDFSAKQADGRYGKLYIAQPESTSMTHFDIMDDIRVVSRTQFPVDVWVCDYLSMMRPVKSGRIERSDVDQMVRDIRRFSLTDHITVITACQANRKGHEEALKRQDKQYELDAISDYSELYKSSTVVVSLMMTDEMKASNTVQIQNLKFRSGPLFPTFKLVADMSTGWYFQGAMPELDEVKVEDLIDI